MCQLHGPQGSNLYMRFQPALIFNSVVSHWTEDVFFPLKSHKIYIISDSILYSITLSFTFQSFGSPPNTFVRVHTEVYVSTFLCTDANKKQCYLRQA